MKKVFRVISVNTPLGHCDSVRKALGNAGAGKISGYSHCSFSIRGVGRSIPSNETSPFLGENNRLEEIEEERIESFCEESQLQYIISAIKEVHPYEEPVITVSTIEVF